MGNAAVANDLDFELSPVERLLAHTPLVALGEFRCPTDAPQFRGGGPQPCAYVVFPRTPVKISPYRGRSELCTPAIASYYNEGDVYDRQAVSDRGDNSDWIAVSRSLVNELVADSDASASCSGFSGCFAPIASEDFLAQQRLFRRVGSGPALSALQIEEAVLSLLRRMLADAVGGWTRSPVGVRSSRPETERRRQCMVDEARQLIAIRFREEFSLSDLARQVNASPGHLARGFRALTGTTVHDYRMQLRLRAALPLLPDFRNDLSSLALDLGFSSHSHFGEAFRRQFGLTPSDYAGHPRLN
jgi:AraC-like DNA-binding protein